MSTREELQTAHDDLADAHKSILSNLEKARADLAAAKVAAAERAADQHFAGVDPTPPAELTEATARLATLEAAEGVIRARHSVSKAELARHVREAAHGEAKASAEAYHAKAQQLEAIVQAAVAAWVAHTGGPFDFGFAMRDRPECHHSITGGKVAPTVARIAELRGEVRKHGGDFDGDALLTYRPATDTHRAIAHNAIAALFEV